MILPSQDFLFRIQVCDFFFFLFLEIHIPGQSEPLGLVGQHKTNSITLSLCVYFLLSFDLGLIFFLSYCFLCVGFDLVRVCLEERERERT